MEHRGGLKLALKAGERDDRRLRFAAVAVAPLGSGDEVSLVTDSRGRLRYGLPAGDYRLRVEDGGETKFAVRDDGWTSVRLRLS
jgi:hypothetical protein